MKYLKPFKKIFSKEPSRAALRSIHGGMIDNISNPDTLKQIINVIGEGKYKKAYDFFSRISKVIQDIDFDYIKDRFVDIEDKYSQEVELSFCLQYHDGSSGILEDIKDPDPNAMMKSYLRRYTLWGRGDLDYKFGILISICSKSENDPINWEECIEDTMKFYESIKPVIDSSHIKTIDKYDLHDDLYVCRSIIYLNF